MEKEKLSWVDSLKGIAICGIIMVHSGVAYLPGILGSIGSMGRSGVQLFFLVSALLAYVSLDRFFNSRKSEVSMKMIAIWWKKKFIRLAPLWYLSIIVCTIYGGNRYWLGSEKYITVKNVLAHVLFLHELFPHYISSILGVEWYLGNLAIFFILVPFIYKRIDSLKKSMILVAGSTFFCNILNYYAVSFLPQTEDAYIYEPYISTTWIFAQLPVLMLGIVLYFILKKDIWENIKHKKLFSYAILIISTGMMGGVLCCKDLISDCLMYEALGIWFAFIAVSQVIVECPLLVNPLFSVLGKYSYPMYLFHYLIIGIYEKYMIFSTGNGVVDWGIKYISVFAVSLLSGWLLTKFVDAPVKKWLDGERISRA